MIFNTKYKSILLLGIVLTYSTIFSCIFVFNLGDIHNNSKISTDSNVDDFHLRISKNQSSIHIIGNSGWISYKNITNCTGQGTYSDPYVIEDLVFNRSAYDYCIFIENSNVYFRIENCKISNAEMDTEFEPNYWEGGGIVLTNVNNVQLINNTCSRNTYGILLYYSNNNTILGNNVSNNYGYDFYWEETGIILSSSSYNNLTRNILYNNNRDVIRLSSSHHNLIVENIISIDYNTRFPWIPTLLVLRESNYNTIVRNNFISKGDALCWSEDACIGNVFKNNFCYIERLNNSIAFFLIFLTGISLFVTLIMLITKKKK